MLGLRVLIRVLSIVGLVVCTRSRPGEALGHPIAGGRYAPETDEQISALLESVAVLRHRLQETQERVEFAKRLLRRGDRAEALPR